MDWRAESDRYRIWYPAGQFPKELASFEAKNASPESTQMDGYDGDVGSLDNREEAAAEALNLTRAAQATFRENTDDVAPA